MSEAPTLPLSVADNQNLLDAVAPSAHAETEGAVIIDLDEIRRLKPADAFMPGYIEKTLAAIEAHTQQIQFDASTPEGREKIRSHAYRLRQTKSALDDMGKALTEAWRQRTDAVNAVRQTIRARLDKLINLARAKLTAFEIAEEQRVLELETALGELQRLVVWPPGTVVKADMIEPRLKIAQRLDNRDFQEFTDRAARIRWEVTEALTAMLADARQREADEAELVALRAEQAQRVKETEDREAADRQRARAEEAAAALVAKTKQDAEAAQQALVAKHDKELREAVEREQGLRQREAAATQMVAARTRDEASRVAVAVEQSRKEDAQAIQQAQLAKQEADAKEAKRARARAHVREVNRMMIALAMEVTQIGEVPARRLIEAIAGGRFTPYIALDYQGRFPL
jgi:hypothetical protein